MNLIITLTPSGEVTVSFKGVTIGYIKSLNLTCSAESTPSLTFEIARAGEPHLPPSSEVLRRRYIQTLREHPLVQVIE
jgi:hypothetical protein